MPNITPPVLTLPYKVVGVQNMGARYFTVFIEVNGLEFVTEDLQPQVREIALKAVSDFCAVKSSNVPTDMSGASVYGFHVDTDSHCCYVSVDLRR